jgi:myo-inositol-1(or 4)-monophosphatase
MSEIMTVCTAAAEEAGEFLKANFGKNNFSIETKADHSLVTNLDQEAERMIVEQIKRYFPDHGIIGEEGGGKGKGEGDRDDAEYIWIIDPLDGTHNFIRNLSLFGVSIGVVHHDDFITGVIYMPVSGELYTAERGGGAYKNGKKINVSGKRDLADCSVAFDSNINKDPTQKLQTLDNLATKAFGVRMLGSSARQLTYLAEGAFDAIIEFDDHPWDYAAGACIVTEAGGRITNLQGGVLTHHDIGFLASNGKIHQQIQGVIHPSFAGATR